MIAHSHRVRYHETDAQGFVFNSRYLEFADVAMSEFFRTLGWSYTELVDLGCDASLVEAKVSYRKPAKFDDVLDIDVVCPRVGRSSFDLEMTMRRGDETIAEVSIVYVNVDTATESSRPLPEEVATALRATA